MSMDSHLGQNKHMMLNVTYLEDHSMIMQLKHTESPGKLL